ncbi:MAG: ABC transporter ATP-binding protein [Candidatus Ventricola sp.]
MQEVLLSLQHIKKDFGEGEVLSDISLDVHRGEFVTLLGASGCGKTTTLRIISGLETADEGRVLLGGRDMTDLPPEKRPVNTVFQSYALFPHMNVERNVAYGLRLRGMDKRAIDKRVREMLELVQMSEHAGRMPSQLSGGQRQRIAIARALALEPELLLLDEPLGALDLQLRRQMQVELKRLQKQLGITFIYITHDQEEAVNMSDRIAVMRSGRFEQIGTPEEIYDAPMTRYVAQFIGRSTILTGTVTAVNGDTAVIEDENGRYPADASRARLTPGEACDLCVRTERMRVSREPVPGFSLPCTVKEARYAGGSVLTYVTMAGGAEAVATGEERMADAAQPGDTVYLCWNPAQAAVIGGASHGA